MPKFGFKRTFVYKKYVCFFAFFFAFFTIWFVPYYFKLLKFGLKCWITLCYDENNCWIPIYYPNLVSCFFGIFWPFSHIICCRVNLTLVIHSKLKCISIIHNKMNCWVPLNCPNLASKHTFLRKKVLFISLPFLLYNLL